MEEGVETTMKLDRWGYPIRTTSDACIAAINACYEQLLVFGRNRAVILDATRHDPTCALANVLAAHFLASQDSAKAASFLSAAASSIEGASSYEKAVFQALSCLLGDGKDEYVALDRHFQLLKEYPKDLASLKRAQGLCFYMGRPDLSLNLVEQVMPHNQDQDYVYGMLAFPLLELGRMSEAEMAARKGFELNKNDPWSQHCLCHVLQYECHFKEAVSFMESCSSSWKSCSSFMYTHNWWHVALCYLEGHAPLGKVLEVYDNHIWKELERSDAVPAEVYLNALGLFLRIYVRGYMESVEDRFTSLANAFKNKAVWHLEWLLDLLGLWALASSKNTHKANELLMSMKSRFHSMSKEKQHTMQKGILLAEAIYEYGCGNYRKVFDKLGPDFQAIEFRVVGASEEQIDVFNEVWYDVLLKIGCVSKAITEIENQIKKKGESPFLWRMLEKACILEGKEYAHIAGEKAKYLETAYFP
ncbi:tetratricopeptide repeat protein 38 [Dioscorea cayenensis subsp. rotundata]|uniref:Tetratricopeptide repeat protein 38 n=1 Tax=Dioscorea cayennensis subsp. rotundata TaxID=55577 RepID=A0AB40AXF0_DIOCR|nr:tetratricopeptide repeat protein 38 [Dioscorea cayenensis subsp. rotundata]